MLSMRHFFEAPPGQVIASPGPLYSYPGIPRDVHVIRHRTTDFEVWAVVRDRSLNIGMPGLSPTFEPEGRVSESDSLSDAGSVISRVPNLGPTRQESRRYLRRKRRENSFRSSVIPIDGPTNITLARKLGTNDVTLFEDKAANDVIVDADSQYKSGYPTLATSSMLARRNRVIQIPEDHEQPDMKFFAELVKPIQYRWKFQKDKIKTLTPSKHGFHPRSKSPTFHRLIEATEKLQSLAQLDGEVYDERFDMDELETQSQVNVDNSEKTVLRYTRSEPYSTRSSNITNMPPAKGKATDDIIPDIKPIRNKEKDEVTFIEEDEDDDSYQTPEREPTPPKMEPRRDQSISKARTVDLKKMDSHTEIHLFLPQIQDQMSRDGTPDMEIRHGKNKLVLPLIKDSIHEPKTPDEERNRHRKDRHKTEGKKKKKKINRIKSGNNDKEVPDILNDVATLISMEKEQPSDYHHASMCVFENCKYHMDIKKTTRIRQP